MYAQQPVQAAAGTFAAAQYEAHEVHARARRWAIALLVFASIGLLLDVLGMLFVSLLLVIGLAGDVLAIVGASLVVCTCCGVTRGYAGPGKQTAAVGLCSTSAVLYTAMLGLVLYNVISIGINCDAVVEYYQEQYGQQITCTPALAVGSILAALVATNAAISLGLAVAAGRARKEDLFDSGMKV